MEAGIS